MLKGPLIFGEVLFDCFADGQRILGGAPFNVAWNLQALGLEPFLVSQVGDDPLGREIKGAMLGWGMNTAGLGLDSAHPTGRVDVTLKNGEPSYNIVENSAWDFIEASALPPHAPSLLYQGSLATRNRTSAQTAQLIRENTQAPLFVDVNLRDPWWSSDKTLDLLKSASFAKLNQDEIKTLFGYKYDLEQTAKVVRAQMSLDLLIITLGGEGAMAINSTDEIVRVEPQGNPHIVDTVGAGDAFASVCIAGLMLKWDLNSTLARAQEFASSVVGLRGATSKEAHFYQPFKARWGL